MAGSGLDRGHVPHNGRTGGDDDPWAMSDDDGNDGEGDRNGGDRVGEEIELEDTIRLPFTRTDMESNEHMGEGAGVGVNGRASRDIFSAGGLGGEMGTAIVGGVGSETDGGMSELEMKVLGEYERLRGNMRKVSSAPFLRYLCRFMCFQSPRMMAFCSSPNQLTPCARPHDII